jgi:hypothetical protein
MGPPTRLPTLTPPPWSAGGFSSSELSQPTFLQRWLDDSNALRRERGGLDYTAVALVLVC